MKLNSKDISEHFVVFANLNKIVTKNKNIYVKLDENGNSP